MCKIKLALLSALALVALAIPVLVSASSDALKPAKLQKSAASDRIDSVSPAAATVQLHPLLTGLSAPVLVTTAHDGSNRLFIVEQSGQILVLQPGSTTPTVFLNVSSLIVFGGEQGLLGLTFHPKYFQNGRFFIHYSRASDGEGTIAEYHVSASNPNVADTTGKILLTMPQPFTNHNGGMIEFGPDGFLYNGQGDGGSGFDPGNRAQNLGAFNGKFLRIDVDHMTPGKAYAIPANNPFASTPGALPEIYTYGMRNPWRYSFDKATGMLYCGDVGQNDWEEVDIIASGGNYGWRIFEGDVCTMIDPCVSTGLTFPILVYGHTSGRCGIIGGYVYRGTLGTIAQGLYVYGDICTGEIFTFDGTNQTVLTSIGTEMSSFGQDESGELYVCGVAAGEVWKIEPTTNCTFSLSSPSASFPTTGGTGSFTVNDVMACSWSSFSNASWITVTSGGSGSTGATLRYTVAPNTSSIARVGTISVAGTSFKVTQTAGAPNYVGFLDHLGCDQIYGWAADRNLLNNSINVEIYDGATLIAVVPANQLRPDVGANLGDDGYHGFSIPTPAALLTGAAHNVHVKFVTTTSELHNSPANLMCTALTPRYAGFVDVPTCSTIAGWAADRSRLNQPISVSLYDGTTLLATMTASLNRPDVGAFLGDNGLHGYLFYVPASIQNGAGHSVHLRFETSAVELTHSPTPLTCP
ncbi:MAG TPA: PQQ-dependent sugar dehydrogenase [Blastocatellia bacterium]|nr:PQQ-dependent sugar dehydrogenase [Blastocatellia bacterium]